MAEALWEQNANKVDSAWTRRGGREEKKLLAPSSSNIYELRLCCCGADRRATSIPGAWRYLNAEKCMSLFIDGRTDSHVIDHQWESRNDSMWSKFQLLGEYLVSFAVLSDWIWIVPTMETASLQGTMYKIRTDELAHENHSNRSIHILHYPAYKKKQKKLTGHFIQNHKFTVIVT